MKDKKISEIFLILLLLVFGICLVVWADKVTNIVSILLGLIAVIYGIVSCVNYFKNKETTLGNILYFIYGIIVLVLGFILIFRVDFIKELISFVVGIYIVLYSILKLHEVLMIKKQSDNKLTFSVVISIIGLVIGIMCIVGKFLIPNMIVRFIGIMLIVYSIIFAVNYFYLKRK